MSTTFNLHRPLWLRLLERKQIRDVRAIERTQKMPKRLPWRGRKGR